MALNPQQQKAAIDWLREKLGQKQCSECGNASNFGTGDIVNLTAYYPGGSIVVGGPSVPVLPVICNNCGHVRLFSAVAMGILPSISHGNTLNRPPLVRGK
jgi:hypothetical protein